MDTATSPEHGAQSRGPPIPARPLSVNREGVFRSEVELGLLSGPAGGLSRAGEHTHTPFPLTTTTPM